MKHSLESSSAERTRNIRFHSGSGSSIESTSGQSGHGPRVYSPADEFADELIETLKAETKALNEMNGDFNTSEHIEKHIASSTATQHRFPVVYTPFSSPLEVQPRTKPVNPLPAAIVLHQGRAEPKIVKVNQASLLLQFSNEVLFHILQLLDSHSLYRVEESCKKLGEIARVVIPGSKIHSTVFKIRPYTLRALRGECDLDSVLTFFARRPGQSWDVAAGFRKIGLRMESAFTTVGDIHSDYLQRFQVGNQIRQLRLKLSSATDWNRFICSERFTKFSRHCQIELIFNSHFEYGYTISLARPKIAVSALVLDIARQLYVLEDMKERRPMPGIQRLALGDNFRRYGMPPEGMRYFFPNVQELALTSTRDLQYYLGQFPNLTALSISRRNDYEADTEFDPSAITAKNLQSLSLDGINFEDQQVIQLAHSPIKSTLKSLYLLDFAGVSIDDLKSLLPRLSALENLVVAELDQSSLSYADCCTLMEWAREALPKLRVQVFH